MSDNLAELIRLAKHKWRSMSLPQKQKMIDKQRESFVRAMTTPCEHGVLDFETCQKCRGLDSQENER